MPLLSIFIDNEIYNKIVNACREKYFSDVSEFINIALRFMVKIIEVCKENNVDVSECVDKIIDVIVGSEKLKIS